MHQVLLDFANNFQVARARIVHQGGDGRAVWYERGFESGELVVEYRPEPPNWDWDGKRAPEVGDRVWGIVYWPEPVNACPTCGHTGPPLPEPLWHGPRLVAALKRGYAILRGAGMGIEPAGIILAYRPIGRGPFDPLTVAVRDQYGRTSLPVGNWEYLVDPATNLATRPGNCDYTMATNFPPEE